MLLQYLRGKVRTTSTKGATSLPSEGTVQPKVLVFFCSYALLCSVALFPAVPQVCYTSGNGGLDGELRLIANLTSALIETV